MIDKIAVKSGLSLLKWLPVVAAVAFVLACVPKAAMAQSTPSTIGYVVSGCGIDTENGDYYYMGGDNAIFPDDNGAIPYYENVAGYVLYADGDDQDNDDFFRWYIGGFYLAGRLSEDYESGNAGWMSGDSVPVGPATPTWEYDDAPYQWIGPTVISM